MSQFPVLTEAERHAADSLIALALLEDLSPGGDLTTKALIDPHQTGAANVVAREAGVLAGLPVAEQVLTRLDPGAKVQSQVADGARLQRGTVVAELTGPLVSLLMAERTVLNFLTHLSGVATLTRRYVDAIAGTRAAIYDTRKTLPGWRALEKYAVRVGGGRNHRIGLFDMVLIKDNHLAAWAAADPTRTIADAVEQARRHVKAGVAIEVEVDSLDQFRDALSGRPDMVLLDNMSCETLRAAVALRDERAPQVELEASGGITLSTVAAVANTGVERISVGAITHSAVGLDLALDWAPPR